MVAVFASSDAAREPGCPLSSGLGGYCNGLYWRFEVDSASLLLMYISLLELLATIFNVVLLWPRLQHYPAVVQSCDALVAVQILTKLGSKSPQMQIALDVAMQSPTFREAAESGARR